MIGLFRPTRSGLFLFISAFAISFAITVIGWQKQPFVNNSTDPYYFSEMGANLAHEGRFLPKYGNMLHRRTPLYPLMIAGVYKVVGEQPLAVKIVQCLLFAGLCLLVMDLGRMVFNPRTGLIAAWACLLHPIILRYVPDFHLETLLTFLFTLMLWGAVRYYQRPTFGNAIFVGFVAGLASLTKSVVVLYPVIFAVYMLLFHRKRELAGPRRPPVAASLAVMIAAMCLVLLPWSVRNYRVTGKLIPLGTGLSDAFLRGYVFSKTDYILLRKPPYTFAELESNAMFEQMARDHGTVWQRDDVETEKILNEEAKKKLQQDPAAFVRKFFVGIFTFWYEMTSLVNSAIAGFFALVAWAFAFIGWRRARSESQPAWLFLMPVLYLNLLLAALLALGRYSAPVTPALLVVAAFGVDGLLSRRPAEDS